MNYTFLIVDDEKLSRLYIRNLLSEFLPDAVIYDAKDTATARKILLENIIDILFLDIQMPEANGFDLLSEFGERSFEVVMVTAYNQYGIEAVKAGACDYLLKPINKREFRAMLEKVIKIRTDKKSYVPIKEDEKNEERVYHSKKIAVHHQSGIIFIALPDIEYLKAWNTYTGIHHLSGTVTMASKAISKFEQMMDARWFFRVHKSYIVNLKHCAAYSTSSGYTLSMKSGAQIPVSRHRHKAFLAVLEANSDLLNP